MIRPARGLRAQTRSPAGCSQQRPDHQDSPQRKRRVGATSCYDQRLASKWQSVWAVDDDVGEFHLAVVPCMA